MTESKTHVRVIILNYNGAELLPSCLPSIVKAAKRSRYPVKVAIVNNPGGESDGLDYVRDQFPEVDIFQCRENRYFFSYNEYIPAIREPVVILLNNDIRVDEGFIDPLIARFDQSDNVFLVAPRVLTFDGSAVEAGRSKAGMRFGLFQCNARFPGYEKEIDQPSETYSSGFGAFSRTKFLELGGYDSRFWPGIMEDVDLCYRAAIAGYALYYEPKSVVYHMGQASYKKKYGAKKTLVIANKNNFLFMWKHFRGPLFWVQHLFFLPLRLMFSLLRGRTDLVEGFAGALKAVKSRGG